MKITINGKRYRLRDNIVVRLQGLAMVFLGLVCHKVNADCVAVFLWFYGGLMLMPDFRKINRCLLWAAKKIIAKEEKYAVQNGKTKTST
jgi:type IV secretory pathway VirB3-like protein